MLLRVFYNLNNSVTPWLFLTLQPCDAVKCQVLASSWSLLDAGQLLGLPEAVSPADWASPDLSCSTCWCTGIASPSAFSPKGEKINLMLPWMSRAQPTTHPTGAWRGGSGFWGLDLAASTEWIWFLYLDLRLCIGLKSSGFFNDSAVFVSPSFESETGCTISLDCVISHFQPSALCCGVIFQTKPKDLLYQAWFWFLTLPTPISLLPATRWKHQYLFWAPKVWHNVNGICF